MKLGTHNSMSYLPPKKWYLYPFRFIAKCQDKTIAEQYKLGARMFDIRISYDKLGIPEFRHGAMAFKGRMEKVLKYLNSTKARTYVRLLLEVRNTKDLSRQEQLFTRDCINWENNYKGIVFFCGRRKFDWKVVYNFKCKEPDIVQYISSMQGNKIDDLWPWLYSKIHNKKHRQEWDKKKWALFDFIEIN